MSQTAPPPALTDAEKAAAWDAVVNTLNEQMPDWHTGVFATMTAKDAATSAIRRLVSAAEWGDYATLRLHVGLEATNLKGLLDRPDVPEAWNKTLRAHIQRLARLV